MAIENIRDHYARAAARVTSKFRESAHFMGMIETVSKQIQDLEDAYQQMIAQLRAPALASGTTLDLIGKLVQAPERGTKTDAEYRAWIAAQIVVNRSFGSAKDLRDLVAAFLSSYWPDPHVGEVDDPSLLSAFGTQPSNMMPVIEGDLADPPITEQQARDVMLFIFSAKAAGTRPVLGFKMSAGAALFQLDAGPGLDQGNFYNVIDNPLK